MTYVRSPAMPNRASALVRHANSGGFCAACGSAFSCECASLAEFTLGAVAPTSPELPTAEHTWTFPGTASQVSAARRLLTAALGSCPESEDVILCLSELATNAVWHSASARPGGTFTVYAQIIVGAGVYLEVRDDGGPWLPEVNDDRMHGLGIVRSLAASMSIGGDAATGWVVTAWFGWNSQGPDRNTP
jgi:serine/threonine-protein kinase RsbW